MSERPGITPEELAPYLGVSVQTLAAWRVMHASYNAPWPLPRSCTPRRTLASPLDTTLSFMSKSVLTGAQFLYG